MRTHHRADLRQQYRTPVETLCTEVVGDLEQYSLVTELGETGLRLQRPLYGRLSSRIVQLEFEMPEVDELVWAKGLVCFDQLWPARDQNHFGHRPMVRTSGVRVLAAATRHMKMLREYVMEKRLHEPAPHPVASRPITPDDTLALKF